MESGRQGDNGTLPIPAPSTQSPWKTKLLFALPLNMLARYEHAAAPRTRSHYELRHFLSSVRRSRFAGRADQSPDQQDGVYPFEQAGLRRGVGGRAPDLASRQGAQRRGGEFSGGIR